MTSNEVFNPAADEFSYGEQVYNAKRKQTGIVMGTNGTIVLVRYYQKPAGWLSSIDESTSMQDLISDSTK